MLGAGDRDGDRVPAAASLGIAIRNLALALEFLYDHPLHLHLLAGPDYSAAMIGPTEPGAAGARAQRPRRRTPTCTAIATVGELMDDLNPLTGRCISKRCT